MEVIPPKKAGSSKELETKSLSLETFSPEIVEAIYHKVTRKSDKVQKLYFENVEISFEDLMELNRFILQTLKTYKVKPPSVTIRLSHNEGENLQYNSFDKFKIYQTSITKPIKNLNIKYSFLLITPPNEEAINEEPEYSSYEIEINIIPTLIEDDSPMNSLGLRRLILLSQPSIVTDVKYIDYPVARALLGALQEWVATVQGKKDKNLTKLIKKYSDSCFKAIKAVGLLAGFAFVYQIMPKFTIEAGSSQLRELSEWLLISCALILLINNSLKLIESLFSSSLFAFDRYCVLRINSGDKKNADEVIEAYDLFPKKIFKGTLFGLSAIAMNILAAYLFLKFFPFFSA